MYEYIEGSFNLISTEFPTFPPSALLSFSLLYKSINISMASPYLSYIYIFLYSILMTYRGNCSSFEPHNKLVDIKFLSWVN